MGVILVTGASRGIGRGIARELARAGHRVAIHYRGNSEAAGETAAECEELVGTAASEGPAAATFQADISIADDRERLVAEVWERFGAIDGLVNNAGIAPRKRDDIVSAEEAVFDEVMRVNLYGPYFLTQLVARRWIAERDDQAGDAPRRIVFVTSVSAEMVSTSRGEYCVSKAALGMAAQLFAARLAPEGIVVHEVRPGITATDMTAGVTDKYDKLIAEGLVPQNRWGYPEDTGSVVRAIMDGHLDFAAGSVVWTDGGLHIPRL
ncbi:MAG: 3-ketoacyl-ACP reductase [Spirochaetota bacterium]